MFPRSYSRQEMWPIQLHQLQGCSLTTSDVQSLDFVAYGYTHSAEIIRSLQWPTLFSSFAQIKTGIFFI